MAKIFNEISRTFSEYLLIPNLTTEDCTPDQVNLRTPIIKYRKGKETSPIHIHIPFVTAIMQSVSDSGMAIALAKEGGLSFIYGSQSIESQSDMVRKVKKYKSGFVVSDSNLRVDSVLADALEVKRKTGHSTIAITYDGSPNGRLMGIITSRDYRLSRTLLDTPIKTLMTPFEKLVYAYEGTSLKEANDIIWDHKINQLPIVDKDLNLVSMVFRKDYDEHKENPYELLDEDKSYITGAGINTRDYMERVPALLAAGVDVLCIDSSDGFTVWQKKTIDWIKANYPDGVYIGAGNVVDAEGFRYLADAGADFIKVGIGGGSICITREQKGIGCGQASAVMAVAKARDEYFEETGMYIPICSDGGIVHDYHMTLAIAMGADFLMLGRYFARFDESPTRKLLVNGNYVKEYWGEGSNRARNWQRYDDGGESGKMAFEEGVDSYVPYAGNLKDNLTASLAKMKATMCSCGSTSLEEFRDRSRLVMVSSISLVEGGAHDVITKDSERINQREHITLNNRSPVFKRKGYTMVEHKVYEMTYEGIRKLEEELDICKSEKRTEIAERIKQALSFGDLSENSEYDDAKNAQGENESRIGEIEFILKNSKMIDEDEISKTKVTIGAKIKLRDEEMSTEEEYTLVSTKEANIFEKKISTDSPIGVAITGKKKGQIVEVKTPLGTLKYKIVKISKPS